MKLVERPTDEDRDESIGRFMPRIRMPWTVSPDQQEVTQLIAKADAGIDFSPREQQSILSRLVRQSG